MIFALKHDFELITFQEQPKRIMCWVLFRSEKTKTELKLKWSIILLTQKNINNHFKSLFEENILATFSFSYVMISCFCLSFMTSPWAVWNCDCHFSWLFYCLTQWIHLFYTYRQHSGCWDPKLWGSEANLNMGLLSLHTEENISWDAQYVLLLCITKE